MGVGKLHIFVFHSNSHARPASNPDFYTDSTSDTNFHADTYSNACLCKLPLETCLVQVHSGESA